ncbi:MAG TPA: hypothetical protein VK895_13180 [Jiangellaceae bacterium]|nr:hypothetical protein [Jiangellaceae bacterium]
MSDRREPAQGDELGYLPDGRPKLSPDDTSLLGLHAVWSELDEPLPPKGSRHLSRRARRQARSAWRVPMPLVIGISAAVGITLAIIVFLATS